MRYFLILYLFLSTSISFGQSVVIDSLYQSARSYYTQNEFSKAMPLYLKIDSIAGKNGIVNSTVINAILDRSEISRTTFNHEGVELAHDLQKEALSLAIELSDEEMIHNIYLRLADIYGLKDNYDSSKYFLDKAFSYYKQQENVKLLTRLYLIYMNYYYATENLDSAGIKLEEGIAYLKTKDEPDYLARVLVSYGRYFSYKLGDCQKGIEPLLQAKQIFTNKGDTLIDRYIYLNEELALCYAEIGKFQKAYEHYKTAFYTKYELDRRANKELSRTLETKYQAEAKEKEIELLSARNALAEQKQKEQLFIFIGISIVLIIILLVLYLLYKNRQKTNAVLRELDTAKSRFFANISHEFRTPLTLIKGPVEQMLNDESFEKAYQNNFKLINNNTDRLLSLVDQLLDLSKLEANSMKLRVSKNDLATDLKVLISSFEFRAKEKKIEYTYDLIITAKDYWYDRSALEKIAFNLISNALKYTPENGSVSIKAELINNTLAFSVKNSGSGISREDMDKILNRFYQADSGKEGFGIGLALVNELTLLHKGKLKFSSHPNENTEFKVELPVNKETFGKEDIVDAGEAVVPVEAGSNHIPDIIQVGEKTNIPSMDQPVLLIVEDSNEVRSLVRSIFHETYRIVEASNGEEGIEKAIETIPDIIISDVMMPIKDGIELSNTLKTDERTSHIPIILLTAKAGDENILTGLDTGADDYITKPFNLNLLKLRVSKLIEIREKLRSRYSQELILKPKDISVTSADEKFLEKVQTLLEEQLTSPEFNAERFSKELGMSRMQLHRKLKALTGLTTTEFIRSQRLKMAVEMLKAGDTNISEVGYAVGFNEPSYFAKCFKEAYDYSPSEFLKSIKD